MNYYEELGLQPTASEDDIRRAHRALAKLLHPDHQTDPSIRDTAESQMRRINGIIDILLDPHRREQYDQHLRMGQAHAFGDAHAVISRFPAVRIFGSVIDRGNVKDYLLSFGATIFFAVALTLTAAWFLAGDFLHVQSTTDRTHSVPATLSVAAAPVSAGAARHPPAHRRSQIPQIANPSQGSSVEIGTARPTQTSDLPLTGDGISLAVPMSDTASQSIQKIAELIKPPSAQKPEAATLRMISHPLSGLWVYVPGTVEPVHSHVAIYTPVYIQVNIQSENGRLRGEYNSQYRVPDRPISSEVAFQFEGSEEEGTLNWHALDGTRGILILKLQSAHALEVSWRVTEFGSHIGLGAGTAILIRRVE